MNPRKLIASSVLAVIAASLIGYPAFAMFGDSHDLVADAKKIAAQFDQNKTTLAKAVAAAEQHSKGRAVSVLSDVNDEGAVAVHVYCLAGEPAKIMMCYFDHKTGTVKGMKEVKEFPITSRSDDHADGRGHLKEGHRDHGDDHAAAPVAKTIDNQTLEVSCGSCLYKMPGVEGCHLAIMIDGKPYLVEGAKWPNHDYCDRKLQAVVSGKLEGNPPKFTATKFEPKL